MAADRPRCAEAAAAAGDPAAGTAPPAEQWFLVEHPGPWGRDPLWQSGLDPRAAAALAGWAAAYRGRIVLVRRPGRPGRCTAPRRWFRVDARPGREAVRTGRVVAERDLVGVLADPDAGEPHGAPLLLVCTHGRHDPCCAVHGRPLAAAAAGADPEATWECSHLGGCRFAPALVLLPHGWVLGRVPPAEVAAVIRAYRAGRLDPRYLRGRSALAPAVQAAEVRARAEVGDDRVEAFRVAGVDADGQVRFADPDHAVTLRERRVEAGRPLTCAARAPGWQRVFEPDP